MPKSLARLAMELGGVRRDVDARQLEPMRPTVGRPPIAGAEWIYELKLDGFRLLADARDDHVTLRYRSGHDCTQAFPELVETLGRLHAGHLLVDGEVVAWDEHGRPDFDRLAPRLHRSTNEPKPPVSYHLFDVVAVAGVDVRDVPLLHRKALLERIVALSKGFLRSVPYVVGDGRGIAAFVAEHDLEGFVAKRAASSYASGPSRSWLKVKSRHEEDFLVIRIRRDRDGRIDALALGALDGAQPGPRGVVELGAWRASAFTPSPPHRRAGWTAASERLVVSVTFTGRTSAGRLREPAVKGVRAFT